MSALGDALAPERVRSGSFATHRSQTLRIPSPRSPESRPDFNAVTSLTWFSSSATEEHNHAGSSERYPGAFQAGALEQRQGDWSKAAAATQTRLVDPDETSDRRSRSGPCHVQFGDRQQASWM